MEIEKLPTEISANIFSRLPFETVLQCKGVSKSWCNLLKLFIHGSDLYFAKLHHSRIMDSSSSPDSILIMLDQSVVDNNRTCVEENGDQLHYVEEYNEEEDLQNMGFNLKAMKKFNSPLKMDSKFWTMASSSNGLICSAHQTDPDDDSYLLYIYNPFLGEYVTLPNNFKHSSESSMAFGFGHIPSTDEYKVVRIVYPPGGGGDDGNVEVYTLGGDKSSSGNGKWRSKAYVLNCRLQCDSPGVLVNESLHWLTQKDEKTKKQNILTFNLVEEGFHRIPLPRFVQANSTVKIRELEGSLCGIDYRKDEREMFMWKFMEDDKKNTYWKNFFGMRFLRAHKGVEHCFYWKKVDQFLLWMSNSSVVAVEHDVHLGPKMDLTELGQARLFHGIPHIKSFVSLTALGENDVKTIKDINRKRKRGDKQRRKQKRRGLYIVYSSDDE